MYYNYSNWELGKLRRRRARETASVRTEMALAEDIADVMTIHKRGSYRTKRIAALIGVWSTNWK